RRGFVGPRGGGTAGRRRRRERRIDARKLLQPPDGAGCERHRGLIARAKQRFRLVRARTEPLRRRQDPPLLREHLVFPGTRIGLAKLVELVAQEGGPLASRRLVRVEARALPVRLGKSVEGLLVGGAKRPRLREGIEEIEM